MIYNNKWNTTMAEEDIKNIIQLRNEMYNNQISSLKDLISVKFENIEAEIDKLGKKVEKLEASTTSNETYLSKNLKDLIKNTLLGAVIVIAAFVVKSIFMG